MRKTLAFCISGLLPLTTLSAQSQTSGSFSDSVNNFFSPIVKFLDAVLFWDPVAALGIDAGIKIPFIIIWLVFGALFFTIYFRFINLRGFRHAIELVMGKFDKEGHDGEISHFQAIATATASTVGLGNIAGVAVAISLGGPGATFWLIVAGLLGMSTKFTECTLGVKYRKINPDNTVSGGPMYYLKEGLAKRGWSKLGKTLSVMFAIFAAIGAFGIGNMFQSNQVVAQTVITFPQLEGYQIWIGIAIAILVGVVIIGGIKGIAKVNDKLFPIMAILYITSCLVVIGINYRHIDDAFLTILNGAFNADAAKGGFIGVMIIGFRRAAFSNEAGIGSAAIAHSTVKTQKPVTEGIVALLEPFIDTVVICTMTALVIIVTGLYDNPQNLNGADLTSAAFSTVSSWFPYLLLPTIILFAYTTIISWSYYGATSFDYLLGDTCEKTFGKRIYATRFYQIIFLIVTAIGSVLSLSALVDFSDMLILSMAVPNIIGLLILAPEVRTELKEYMKWLKTERKLMKNKA
ncbi:MAG: amino acid carrier protein [Bacteroidetes bacterium]|jgi:AGCS family alanine or glycine:cation symporter|nr:amino acid carrier protein [Bacteroidota bacterium]